MWSHRFDHYEPIEPLLKRASTDLLRPTSVLSKKEISDSIHREQSISGSQFRSAASTRWYILFGVALAWLSSYFNAISPIYFKDAMMNEMNLTERDYSYIVSLTYIVAVFTPLFIPRILLFFNGSSLLSLICIQFISFSGEILLYLAIQFFAFTARYNASDLNIALLYIGRILVGVALGCNDSIILSMLIFWYKKSQNISFASTFIYIAVVFAVIIARLSAQFMSSLTLSSSFIIPIVVNLVSIWILFAVNCIKNTNVPPIYDQMILRDFYASDSVWSKCAQIPHILWLIIVNTALILAVTQIIYTLFLPDILLHLYSFSMNETLIILLLLAVVFILWSSAASFLMDNYGYFMQWNIWCTFLCFVSFLFLFFGANDNKYIGANGNKIYAIVSLCILSISTLFISSHLTLSISCCEPIEFAPYCASIITILHWAFYVLFGDMITWLHSDQRYLDSILFILCLSFAQFLISALVYGMAVKLKLKVHHSAHAQMVTTCDP